MGATDESVGSTVVARSKPITALGLKALTAADAGKTINFGESMAGKVHVGREGAVSVHATWRYRIGGKTREVRIGTWREVGGMTLKALRDERDRLATELRSGIDPIERKAANRLAAEAAHAEQLAQLRSRADAAKAAELERERRLTVRQLFERWRETQLQPRVRADGRRTGRKDGGQYVSEQFERHVFPALGDSAVADLRKADLLALLDAQTSVGKMRTANVLLADLKQMLDFAADRELIVGNPLASTKKAKVGGSSVERERNLSEAEVKALVAAVPAARMQPRSALAIWLILATGVRVGELAGAAWTEGLPARGTAYKAKVQALREAAEAEGAKVGIVDIEARTWYLPDTKNQRDHTIHLSDFAVAQLRKLALLREKLREDKDAALSPWVFPATDNHKPVCIKSFGKQLADRQRPPEKRMVNRTKATTSLVLTGGKWTAHDLRRTAATFMARLGFGSDTINECLNHKQSDPMARVYIKDRRQPDQARAFDALGARLFELVEGVPAHSNVVPLDVAA